MLESQMVIFGGRDSTDTALDDLWSIDLTTQPEPTALARRYVNIFPYVIFVLTYLLIGITF